jgi:hypothetical protein
MVGIYGDKAVSALSEIFSDDKVRHLKYTKRTTTYIKLSSAFVRPQRLQDVMAGM